MLKEQDKGLTMCKSHQNKVLIIEFTKMHFIVNYYFVFTHSIYSLTRKYNILKNVI